MDMHEILRGLGESMTDYAVSKNLLEIGKTLDALGDGTTNNPEKKLAYRVAATAVLTEALNYLNSAHERIPVIKDEAE